MPSDGSENGNGPPAIATANTEPSAAPSLLWSLRLLSWIGLGAVLYFGKAAFAPLLFAVLLALLLSPFVDLLARYRIPRLVGALFSVCLLLASITLIVDAVWTPAMGWVEDAPAIMQRVERKIRPLQRAVARVDSLTTRATTLAATTPNVTQAPVAPHVENVSALGAGRTILIDVATVSILTVFLLAVGGKTLHKLEKDMATHGTRLQYLSILAAVRTELSRYYSTLALINVGLGLATTGVMTLWGLPNPWLWGLTAGVLNFIPYVGPTVTLMVITVVSLVSIEGYGTAIGAASSFLMLTTIEGQIIQPLLIGFRLNLNPIILFVAIWLAGWFWGVAGVFLAMPLMIALKEIAACNSGTTVLKSILCRPDAPTSTKTEQEAAAEALLISR
jgi:predicted PurR-regulated permease PerM